MRTHVGVGVVAIAACIGMGAGIAMYVGTQSSTRPEPAVTIIEGQSGVQVDPPQQLDVIMDGIGDDEAQCNDMGGRWEPPYCRNVDY